MKRKKSTIKIIVISIFTVSIILMATSYAILKQKIQITGKASLVTTTKDYDVTYVIENKWYSGGRYYYRITMTLHNNTNTTLNGWNIKITVPKDTKIENYANTSCKKINTTITFENLSYNAQVPGKSNTSFEFQISTTEPNYKPSDIIINGETIRTSRRTRKARRRGKKSKYKFSKNNTMAIRPIYILAIYCNCGKHRK